MGWIKSNRDKQLSDEELYQNFSSTNDRYWVEILFDRYVHLVYGVCLKYLKDREKAQDATMDVFEDMISKGGRYQIKKFSSWLYSTSKNTCLMKLRSEKGRQRQDINQRFMESGEIMHPIDEDSPKENHQLMKCVHKLKDPQRMCITLFYFNDLSYAQIAEKTGFSLNEVKTNIQNGKRNLKICLEDD